MLHFHYKLAYKINREKAYNRIDRVALSSVKEEIAEQRYSDTNTVFYIFTLNAIQI